ncbi:recombinase RecT [Marinitoga sp. 1197]|uniref:recombination protein RecT n=1 Tax=unclassified Marinitoga TaxID=2640159 RepID=UPI0006411FFF|nr:MULTISPECIES: recombination protein RecT [unclassified Marinitoga]AJW76962.1 recombinational DNA repair protein RecT [Marinitoga camini virus 1]AJW76967.1 recombinational DNA repair protein RecT [Marinitoga camini virus 2]KLO23998.1 recombinase RecT [Marinitoga sp. 1197]KLO24741.1 recombinase RecT [Marinitoga sp. 1155]
MANTKQIKDKLKNGNNKAISPIQKNYVSIEDYLRKHSKELQQALPKHMDSERLARVALTTMRQNPKLLQCSLPSLVGAILQAAQLGLEPNVLGHAYFIPYYSSKTRSYEVQFQIGYKGLLELVRRTGEIETIQAHEVCENDEFEYEYGINLTLKHKPALKNRGEAYAYYAVAKYKTGEYDFLVMGKEDIEKIRKRSKSPNNGPWVTDYDAMAKKTVIKQLCKYLPLSIEIQKAITADETTKREIAEDIALEIPDETDWETPVLVEDIGTENNEATENNETELDNKKVLKVFEE